MERLQVELRRLYHAGGTQPETADSGALDLMAPDGRTRALVLALAGPSAWEPLSRLWQGVQAELELPAPAIAVSGVDGYQLWFSLVEAVPTAQALVFLASLRAHYLADVGRERIALHPCQAALAGHAQHVGAVPPVQAAAGRWSAFVAPDLAPLFADEPWLDLPPTPDAQADLLSRVQSARPAAFQRALERLAPAATSASNANAPGESVAHHQDPRRFLLAVMNDPAIELHLRIEAAKALLPWSESQGGASQ